MPSKLTYTGVTGPGVDQNAVVYNDIKQLCLDPEHGTMKIKAGNDTFDVDLSARTTITITISAGVITATIS
jgi:hypothetical protein